MAIMVCLFVSFMSLTSCIDDFASIPTIRAFVERLSSPKSLEVVKGVDHFWHGQESSLVEIVLKWLDSRILN